MYHSSSTIFIINISVPVESSPRNLFTCARAFYPENKSIPFSSTSPHTYNQYDRKFRHADSKISVLNMSSTHAVRFTSLALRPSLTTAYRTQGQVARPAANFQACQYY